MKKTAKFDYLIYILICLYILITPIIPINFIVPKFHYLSELTLLLVIILFIVKKIILNKGFAGLFSNIFIKVILDKTALCLTLLFIIMAISIIYSTDKKLALSESLRFLSFIMLFVIIKSEINTLSKVNGIIRIYIVTCLLISVFGIIQYFTGWGLDKIFLESGYAKIKITSTLDNPNNLAAFVNLAIFPVFMISLYEKSIFKKVMYSVTSLFLLINSILTFSRNALVGLLVGFCILTLVYSWKLIILILISGPIAMKIPEVMMRIKAINDTSQNRSRIYLWNIAAKMIKDHPILGIGNGNYITLYNAYVKRYPEYYYGDVKYSTHNTYLKIQSELGILGSTAFFLLVVRMLSKLRWFVINVSKGFYKYYYIGFLASFIAFLVMNLFDNLFFVPKTVAYFWIMTALMESIIDNKLS